MLDAFIIDKIRRERDSRQPGQIPLRIEIPQPQGRSEDLGSEGDWPGRDDRGDGDRPERGIAIIDFTL